MGVPPPGAYYSLRLEKEGCRLRPFPVDHDDRTDTGQVSVQPDTLSQATLFVE